MEQQFSVGADRPVKEDHLWKWTTLTGKFPPGPKHSIYVWTEISGNFGIMESTPGLHYRALTGKILVFGLGGCRLKRGGRIWRFDCIKYGTYIPHLPLEKLFYCPESSSPGMNSYQHLQLLHYSKHKSFV